MWFIYGKKHIIFAKMPKNRQLKPQKITHPLVSEERGGATRRILRARACTEKYRHSLGYILPKIREKQKNFLYEVEMIFFKIRAEKSCLGCPIVLSCVGWVVLQPGVKIGRRAQTAPDVFFLTFFGTARISTARTGRMHRDRRWF